MEPGPSEGEGAARDRQFAQAVPCFERTDWLSFALATAATLAVYLVTLAPTVTTGFSGIFSVGAQYAGVPHPPGYPVWTLYAWCFTEFLPISNVAWRAALASAVAGSLCCGVVALIVSRMAGMLTHVIFIPAPIPLKDERALRVVSGAVAGLGLGFDGAFWRKAVVADPWPMSLLLFAITLALLSRWCLEPRRLRPFYLGCFFFGLTVANSQALIPAGAGLPVFALLNLRLGLFAWAKFAAKSVVMLLLGMSACLYVPVASMTNPPVNWGYARTAEGFIHTITRSQYERVQPTPGVERWLTQVGTYAELAVQDFGGLYLLPALVPFAFIRRLSPQCRRWMCGLLGAFVGLSLLTVWLLNPDNDRQSREMIRSYYTASHLVLAIWSGCGLAIVGRLLTRPATGSAPT